MNGVGRINKIISLYAVTEEPINRESSIDSQIKELIEKSFANKTYLEVKKKLLKAL